MSKKFLEDVEDAGMQDVVIRRKQANHHYILRTHSGMCQEQSVP